MRTYDTGLSNRVFASVIVAIIVTAGVLIVATNLPGGDIVPTTTTSTTTTTTTTTIPTNPINGLGAKAAQYLNSMRDNVIYYWMSNSTFVNVNLSSYYNSQHPGAYIDGVYMTENATGGEINILFAPYMDNITGRGTVTETQWNSLAGSIIDDGIGQMEAATSDPTGYWPHTWPIDFYMTAYFNDNTCFYFGFTSADGFVYIQNGTWDGDSNAMREPAVISWSPGYWLNENGHLQVPMQNLYNLITSTVSYPE